MVSTPSVEGHAEVVEMPPVVSVIKTFVDAVVDASSVATGDVNDDVNGDVVDGIR